MHRCEQVETVLEAQASQICTKRPRIFRVMALQESAQTALSLVLKRETLDAKTTYGDLGKRARRGDTMFVQIMRAGGMYSSESPKDAGVVVATTLDEESKIVHRVGNGEMLSSSKPAPAPSFGQNCLVLSSEPNNPVPSVSAFIHVVFTPPA